MKTILLVSERCPRCPVVKKRLAEVGSLDKVELVDADTDRGQELINKLGLKGVPECVILDVEGNRARKCTTEEWNKLVGGK